MSTTLRVLSVLHTPDYRVATLEHREWFARSPEHDRYALAYAQAVERRGQEAADAAFAGEPPDEFLSAEPRDAGAFHVVPEGSRILTLRVPDECVWLPGYDIEATFSLVSR